MEVEEIVPLRNRSARYGGRIEVMPLHYRVKEGGRTIQNLDVRSLYPWVFKYLKLPKSSTIQLECEVVPAVLAIEGLMSCTVQTSLKLYHPVLAYRCNGCLLFCLCMSCPESGPLDQCLHETISDRVLTATPVVNEVRVAVEHV